MTRDNGFFVDTLLDSDPETKKIKARHLLDQLLDLASGGGEPSPDDIIDVYSFASERTEMDDFSTEEIEGMLGDEVDDRFD